MAEQFLTPKQASKLYPLSVSLIYALCDEKRIAHVRVGARGRRGKILIRPSDLDRFLEEQRIEAR